MIETYAEEQNFWVTIQYSDTQIKVVYLEQNISKQILYNEDFRQEKKMYRSPYILIPNYQYRKKFIYKFIYIDIYRCGNVISTILRSFSRQKKKKNIEFLILFSF